MHDAGETKCSEGENKVGKIDYLHNEELEYILIKTCNLIETVADFCKKLLSDHNS